MKIPTHLVLTVSSGKTVKYTTMQEILAVVMYVTRSNTLVLSASMQEDVHDLIEIARQELQSQFPWLKNYTFDGITESNYAATLNCVVKKYGEYLNVTPIKNGSPQ